MEAVESWFAIDVTVHPAAADAVQEALAELDALGTEIDNLGKRSGENLTVTGYFSALPDMALIEEAVLRWLDAWEFADDRLQGLSTRVVEAEDWLAEWKRHWRPTVAGRFVIAPPWHQVDEGEHIVIKIEPAMAFGTGTHETTRLCLKALGNLIDNKTSVLDVGTGTGILAIAAAKLGTGPIHACDIDADSVRIARENAVLNDVAGMIEFGTGSITNSTSAFDVVVANLTLDAIEPNLKVFLSKTNRSLVLSGILSTQEDEIRSSLASLGYDDPEIVADGEWLSAIVKVN